MAEIQIYQILNIRNLFPIILLMLEWAKLINFLNSSFLQKKLKINLLKLIRDYATYPLFVQVYGVQISLTDESKSLTTRDWFEKERKDKQNSELQLRDVILIQNF